MVERRGSLSGSETWEGNINSSDVLCYTLRQRLPHTLRAMETTHWPSEKNNAEIEQLDKVKGLGDKLEKIKNILSLLNEEDLKRIQEKNKN